MQRAAIYCWPDLIGSSCQITVVAEVVREEDSEEQKNLNEEFEKVGIGIIFIFANVNSLCIITEVLFRSIY